MISKIYEGLIRHERVGPVPHDFQYALYLFAVDLAEVPVLDMKLLQIQ